MDEKLKVSSKSGKRKWALSSRKTETCGGEGGFFLSILPFPYFGQFMQTQTGRLLVHRLLFTGSNVLGSKWRFIVRETSWDWKMIELHNRQSCKMRWQIKTPISFSFSYLSKGTKTKLVICDRRLLTQHKSANCEWLEYHQSLWFIHETPAPFDIIL
jgi:hypothetical protein